MNRSESLEHENSFRCEYTKEFVEIPGCHLLPKQPAKTLKLIRNLFAQSFNFTNCVCRLNNEGEEIPDLKKLYRKAKIH